MRPSQGSSLIADLHTLPVTYCFKYGTGSVWIVVYGGGFRFNVDQQ